MSKKLVNSVRKALDVLDILTFDDINRKGIPLAELSRRTNIPSNTLHALLSTLAACDYVEQNKSSSYLASSKINAIGRLNFVRRELAKHLPDILDKYREETGESLVFYTLVNGEKVALHSVNRKGLFGINLEVLRKVSFFANATGRLMYVNASETEQKLIIKRWSPPPSGINQDEILEKGYLELVSHEGKIYNLALPVKFENGTLFGAIGLYAPAGEVSQKSKMYFRKSMFQMQNEIETLLR